MNPMSELGIRNAVPEDVQSLTELSNQLGYATNSAQTKNRLQEILANQENCLYVGITNGKLVGWIHGFYALRLESDSFVEIGGLVVEENYRNQGVGKELVNAVRQWSESKNCGRIRVRCNSIRKESAIFYAKIGFSLTKEQQVYTQKIDASHGNR